MKTSKAQYKQDLKAEFAHYGFPNCPLSDSEIGTLYTLGYSLGDAYGIGCDVNSGFYFDEAIKGAVEQ